MVVPLKNVDMIGLSTLFSSEYDENSLHAYFHQKAIFVHKHAINETNLSMAISYRTKVYME